MAGTAITAITYVDGTLSVDPAPLTISATDSKIYGTIKTFSGTMFTENGLITANGDSITSVTEASIGSPVSVGVGTDPIVVSDAIGTGLSNYIISYVNGTLTVNPATLTITANNDSKVYDTVKTFSDTTFTENGLVTANGDSITRVTETSTGSPVTVTVGTDPIVPSDATGTGLSNYIITYVDGTLTVDPASLTITATDSKIYGTIKTFSGTMVTENGLITANGDSITSVTETSTGSPVSATVGTDPIVLSNATGTGLGNYTITYVNGTLTVDPATLTITANNDSKIYGTVKTFSSTAFTESGLITANGDSITSVTETSTGSPVSATVGIDPIVPSSATGTGLSNYTITYVNGALTVDPATLTITANNDTKIYGTIKTFSSTALTESGLITANGDRIAAVAETSSGSPVAVTLGTDPIVPSDATGTDLGNYIITYVNGTLTVDPATLTIIANNDTKTYGTAKTFGSTAFTESGLVTANGDSITSVTEASTGSPMSVGVGSDPIVLSDATGTGLSNYTISYVNGTLTVNPASLTVTAARQTKVYGAGLPTLAYSPDGFVNGDTAASVLTGSMTTTATASSGVGSYPITQGSLTATNYTITFTESTLSVTPAPLTVTAKSQDIVYGAVVPTLSYSASGLVNGDTTTTALTGDLTSTATASSGVGSYPITQGSLAAANYAITFTGNNLQITPATLTVTADPETSVYGSAIPTLGYAATGFVNGDTIASSLSGALTTTATASSSVGSHPISEGDLTSANYTIAFTGNSLTITPAPLAITANNATGQVDTSLPVFTDSITGLVNGDTPLVVSGVALSTTATPSSLTGQYPIIVTGGQAANYTVSAQSGTLTLTPSPKLVGQPDFAVGSDAGVPSTVTVYNPDGSVAYTVDPFPGFTGGVRVAVGEFKGDGTQDVAVGTGPGITAEVKVYNPSGALIFDVQPFGTFQGGVFVAAGDITGDGKDDLVITPDQSGGPRVEIYQGGNFNEIDNFYGINDPGFRGGARASLGDINGDGHDDLVVSAGFGGGPRISVYDGAALAQGKQVNLVGDFYAFSSVLRNGAYVAVGDVNGDGHADLIFGAGPGGGPEVLVVNGETLLTQGATAAIAGPIANFYAGNSTNRGGVRVAAKDLDESGNASVGAGQGGGTGVTTYLGKALASGSLQTDLNFDGFPGLTGGVYVG